MKIIFLDMDDVLCTLEAHMAAGGAAMDIKPAPDWPYRCILDRDAIDVLNRVSELAGDVLYVCSSTWRQHLRREQIATHLRRFGWLGEFHKHWATPVINGPRGAEISAWLAGHDDVESYAIIDDNPTAGHGHALARFVWIEDPRRGLAVSHRESLMVALRGQAPQVHAAANG